MNLWEKWLEDQLPQGEADEVERGVMERYGVLEGVHALVWVVVTWVYT